MTKPESFPDDGGLCEGCGRPESLYERQVTWSLVMSDGKGGATPATMWLCPECLSNSYSASQPSARVRLQIKPEDALPSQYAIAKTCDEIKETLLAKNRAYGDSALNPVRVFSRASAEEQILVRLDDKLSRLARGSAAGEDVVLDLTGYLVLLMVARKRARASGGITGQAAKPSDAQVVTVLAGNQRIDCPCGASFPRDFAPNG